MLIKKQKVYILWSDSKILGVWSNLKNLLNDYQNDESFPSYSKVSKEFAALRKRGEKVLNLVYRNKHYQIFCGQIKE
jgi:hypothetical protein